MAGCATPDVGHPVKKDILMRVMDEFTKPNDELAKEKDD
jgi:hypothetical protein